MYDTLPTWIQSHNRLGLLFPVRSDIFQPLCLPSLIATFTAREGLPSVHPDCGPVEAQGSLGLPGEHEDLLSAPRLVEAAVRKVSAPFTARSITVSTLSGHITETPRSRERDTLNISHWDSSSPLATSADSGGSGCPIEIHADSVSVALSALPPIR